MYNKPKIIAFYLPQFHEIPENDMWWGKGYTEWTSVKAAEPLYYGHQQPKIPYKYNYYNLLDKKIMVWQSKMSLKAGISGFCFYHYWFKGRKVLEKPVENYLKWKEISQNYCLSWANDSWIRTWSNVDGVRWNSAIDEKYYQNDKGNGVLIEQDYGGRDDWKEHFDYLLNFFMDERYIKIDNAPLFLIYKPHLIKNLYAMANYWNFLAKDNGFSGIYFLVTNPLKEFKKPICGCVSYEPTNTVSYKPLLNKICSKVMRNSSYFKLKKFSEGDVWRRILRRNPIFNMKTYLGAFVGYDDTPRRGCNGFLVTGGTPHKFEKHMIDLCKKSIASDMFGEYIFLTAWNEWAEGAYLEPDNLNKYKYLKVLKRLYEKGIICQEKYKERN